MLNKLIESMIENKNNTGFDLSKSYLSNIAKNNNYDNNLPVTAHETSWVQIDHSNREYLEKTYKFFEYKHLQYFLKEHFEKSSKNNYYPEVYIKKLNVKFYLTSEGIDKVTEIDIEYSKFLDEIYQDIFYLR